MASWFSGWTFSSILWFSIMALPLLSVVVNPCEMLEDQSKNKPAGKGIV